MRLGSKTDPVAQNARQAAQRILRAVPIAQQNTILPAFAERIKPGGRAWFIAQSKHGYAQALAALLANSYSNMLMTGKVPDYIINSNSGLSGWWDTVKRTATTGAVLEAVVPGAGLVSTAVVGGSVALTQAFNDFGLFDIAAAGGKKVVCTPGAGTILGGLIGAVVAVYSGGSAAAAVPAGATAGSVGQTVAQSMVGCPVDKPRAPQLQTGTNRAFPWKYIIAGGVGITGITAIGLMLRAARKKH